ncbi:hypothetical protein [Nocardia sp. NPDC060259]|uniref:TPR repeat region-containing protein n=1 Tax=Nocardia sp. NPDC060259 TaxID=3347088 RepID=UPI00364D1AD5
MLLELGDAWIGVGAELEGLFNEYQAAVTTVNGSYWDGQTADAAQSRAQSDNKTMQVLADKLEAIGTRAKQGYDEINPPLLRARGAIMEAQRRNYQIADSLALSLQNATAEQAKELETLQTELNGAVRSAMQADIAVRDALNAARTELRVAFVSAAALGGPQAKADGQQLIDNPGGMSPEAQQRLIEAGQLTPDQLSALQRGDTATIPASQMEYLNELSRSLDGKSPREIEQMVSKLPPDAQKAVANSFQIMSTPGVNAGPVAADDKELRNSGKGGLAVLPQQMQSSLTRSDLVTKDSVYLVNKEVNLNGVADNKAIAKMIGSGDPQYMVGTDVDRKLLDVGSKYLAGIEDYKDDDHGWVGSTRLQIDGGSGGSHGVVDSFFTTAGKDKVAVEALVTGEGKEELYNNITSHAWTDKGAAPATLFQFADGAATIENPNDPADVKAAERHGKIMSSAAEYLSGGGDPGARWSELTSLDSVGNHTLGERNPLLTQALATGFAPHIETMVGGTSPNTTGFNIPVTYDKDKGEVSSWLDPDGNGTYRGTNNIFSILATDEPSGEKVSEAIESAKDRMMQEYADAPSSPGSSSKLGMIGTLQGLANGSADASEAARVYGDYGDQLTRHNDMQSAFDLPQTILGDVPFVGSYLDMGIENMKPDAPEVEDPKVSSAPNFNRMNYEILERMAIPVDQQSRYGELFDNGGMRTWEDIQRSPNRQALVAQSAELFDSLDRGDGNSSAIEDAYRRMMSGAPTTKKPEPEEG